MDLPPGLQPGRRRASQSVCADNVFAGGVACNCTVPLAGDASGDCQITAYDAQVAVRSIP